MKYKNLPLNKFDMYRLYLFLFLLTPVAACSPTNSTQPVAVASTGPQKIIALGRVEPETKITPVGSETGGIVKKIYYHEGDTVQKGALIIELAHHYEDAKLAQSNAKLLTQQSQIQNFKAQVSQAKIKEENLKTNLDRIKNMLANDAVTKQTADNAQSEYDQAHIEVQRVSDALASEQSKLQEIKADIAVAQADIQRHKIMAPANGIILSMDITEGSSVSTENPLFDFAPAAPLTVLCEVDELLVNQLNLGQKALIRTPGMDDTLDEGEIIYLGNYLKKKSLFSDESSNMEDRRVRQVRIKLSNLRPLLINSRVEAVIIAN